MIKKILIIVFIFISLFFFIYALKGEMGFSNPFGLDDSLNSSYHNITNITKVKKTVGENTTTYTFELKRQPDRKGINYVFVPPNTPIKKASQLLASIPYCNAVNYLAPGKKRSIGYISLFGGLGKDFDIKPYTVYAVLVSEDVNWTISTKNN